MTTTGAQGGRRIRTLFVDDHPLVRRSLLDLVKRERDIEIAGEASSCHEAVALLDEVKPTVVVLDLSLGDRSGLDAIRDIHEKHPEVAILVLSMHDEAVHAQRVLRAGALGYVMKTAEPDRILDGIRAVASGRVFLSPEQKNRMLMTMARGGDGGARPDSVLSDRELTVFDLYGQGLRTGDIAKRLAISAKTVETYRKRIKRKLGLRHAGDLVKSAMMWVEASSNPSESADPAG